MLAELVVVGYLMYISLIMMVMMMVHLFYRWLQRIRTASQYLQQQRSQKTNPKFTPAEVILFRRLYEELNMATRARSGWETFDKRWQQEHKDDETGAIHHRTRKSLVDHASKYRKQLKAQELDAKQKAEQQQQQQQQQ